MVMMLIKVLLTVLTVLIKGAKLAVVGNGVCR